MNRRWPTWYHIVCRRHFFTMLKDVSGTARRMSSHVLIWTPLSFIISAKRADLTGPSISKKTGWIIWRGTRQSSPAGSITIWYAICRNATPVYRAFLTSWSLRRREKWRRLRISGGLSLSTAESEIFMHMIWKLLMGIRFHWIILCHGRMSPMMSSGIWYRQQRASTAAKETISPTGSISFRCSAKKNINLTAPYGRMNTSGRCSINVKRNTWTVMKSGRNYTRRG